MNRLLSWVSAPLFLASFSLAQEAVPPAAAAVPASVPPATPVPAPAPADQRATPPAVAAPMPAPTPVPATTTGQPIDPASPAPAKSTEVGEAGPAIAPPLVEKKREPLPVEEGIITFDGVRKLARELAAKPFNEEVKPLDPFFDKMEYDDHREIYFYDEKALGYGSGHAFSYKFFHPGWMYKKTIAFSEIKSEREWPFECKPYLFHYGRVKLPEKITYPPGFSGFKVTTPKDAEGDFAECMVFMGASYFRVVPKGLLYGISCRAVAINTAQPEGEEFPDFKKFWMVRRGGVEKSALIYALLDGPSITGAYQFEMTPGKECDVKVLAEIYLRKPVKQLGLVPFSSMFWFGENTQPKPHDFRPEVHDSDGLVMDIGESDRFWRPLENSRILRHSVFSTDKLKGFGLAQRDRKFESYEDLEAKYHKRPSVWVEPTSNWGSGKVNLIEMHTGEETWDNVVSFWQPDQQPKVGEPMAISYNMHFCEDLGDNKRSKVTATRRGHIIKKPGEELFIIEFTKREGSLNTPENPPVVHATVEGKAQMLDQRVAFNPMTGGWRAFFRIKIEPETPSLELSCRLLENGALASEIWSYQWKP